MKKDKSHMSQNLSPEQMQKYLNEELSPEEMHAIERDLLDDEFSSEAMEGMESVGGEQFLQDVQLLQDKVTRRTSSTTNTLRYMGIAAAVVVILTATFLVLNMDGPDSALQKESEVAQEVPELEEDKSEKQDDNINESSTAFNNIQIQPEERQEMEAEMKSSLPESIPEDPVSMDSLVADYTVNKDETEGSPASGAAAEEVEPLILSFSATGDEDMSMDTINTALLEKALAVQSEPVNEQKEELATIDAEVSENDLNGAMASSRAKKSRKTTSEANYDMAAPTRTIQGKITSSEDGEALIGVTISLKGTTQGTVSDRNGNFTMELPTGEQTLILNSVGWIPVEIETNEEEELNIELKEDNFTVSEVVIDPDVAREITKVLPRPTDGRRAFRKYIDENLKYPQEARDQGVEGRVVMMVEFNEYGIIKDIKVTRGLGHGCDEEAIRLLKEGPLWEPGKLEGTAIPMEMEIRIRFKLDDANE